jgi:hypothetical protein
MTSTASTSHFLSISSQAVASWLCGNLPDTLWSVDGDDKLSAHLDFPCSTEDLASTLRSINQSLKVQAPDSICQLDESNLAEAMIHIPASPGESDGFVSFVLSWEDQNPEDAWVLSQDLIKDQ